jgi:hypothetical protein
MSPVDQGLINGFFNLDFCGFFSGLYRELKANQDGVCFSLQDMQLGAFLDYYLREFFNYPIQILLQLIEMDFISGGNFRIKNDLMSIIL